MTGLSQQRIFTLLFLLLFYFHETVSGQLSKHGNIWHFGNRAGLDFSNGAPIPLSNVNMDSYEGCAVYCDADGEMLLYTNGGGFGNNFINGPRDGIIWNRNQQVMYKMTLNEGGGYSAAQSSLILPKPGSADRYFVFSMDHAPNDGLKGLSYFEVDMNANAGLGAVVSPNVNVYKPAAEALTAIPMSNGAGFWLINIDYVTNNFIVTSFTNAGIGASFAQPRKDKQPVTIIKASPDGKYLCINGEVYYFDPNNGQINFKEAVSLSRYTLSFSPSSRYLYGFESDASFKILRYDITADSIGKAVEYVSLDTFFSIAGQMQLGPDGNIYWTEQTDEDFLELIPPVSLSVIRCPDGLAPETQRSLLKFPTDFNNAGGWFTSLPNFADYIFASEPKSDTVKQSICANQPIDIGPGPGTAHFNWSTGATTAFVSVNQVGTYKVNYQDACGFRQRTYLVDTMQQVEVQLNTSPITNACTPFPVTLSITAPSGSPILWSDGSKGDSLKINAFGTYTVQVSTSCGDTLLVYTIAPPLFVDQGNYQQTATVCGNTPTELIPEGLGDVVAWSTGDTSATLNVTQAGEYTVQIINNCILRTVRFTVTKELAPMVLILPDVSIDSCFTLPIVLKTSVNALDNQWLWSTGATTASIQVDQYGIYAVTLTNSCGSAQDTFELLKNDANCCFPNMPNAFTPNGDGTNDKFSPVFKGCTVEFLEMYIYSRWGELVFQGIYPNELWDGKNLNGWDAHSDVYYYVITFKVKGGDLERRNGQLTLIR